VPDSDALRARRYRQHRQGDHSLCRHAPRLDASRRAVTPVTAAAEGDGDGFDPMTMLRELAGRLTAAYQADTSNAALARELRMTLQAIEPDTGPSWDPIAELQREEWEARRHERERLEPS
jgi:hypothetical protein